MPLEPAPDIPRNGPGPLDIFDSQAKIFPRNVWWRFAAALACLDAGDARGALDRLGRIAQAGAIGHDLIAAAADQAAAELRAGRSHPGRLALPADYLRRTPGRRLVPPPSALPADRSAPAGFPPDLVLPPITGNGNDFSFLLDAALRDHLLPSGFMVQIVAWVSDADEAEALRRAMSCQIWPASRLRIAIHAEDGTGDLPRRPWQLDQSAQQALAVGADAIVWLEGVPETDPLLIDRIARLLAVSSLAVIPLAVPETLGATPVAARVLQDAFRRERFPSRRVRRLDLAMAGETFAALGGFDPHYGGAEHAALDFAWRAAALEGCYLVPLPIAAAGRRPDPAPIRQADRTRLVDRCACPWDRKQDGHFTIPKVSVYVPAFRAARFIRAAVDSVLDQDQVDLEVCIADDGSPDDTLDVLDRHYGDDARVRWTTARNGGIGAASNRAVAMCRGMYVGQLDSDDRLRPGAVRRLATFLDDNPDVGCVYSSAERIDADGRFLQNEYAWPVFSREKMLLTSIAHHFRMFRRQAYARTDGFREDIVNAVDYDFYLKLADVTKLHHVEEILYQRRWHGANTSSVNEVHQTRNTWVVQRAAMERLGLASFWDVHVPDSDQPRRITWRRRGPSGRTAARRVYYWPDYTRSNPYQRLLYARAAERLEIVAAHPNDVLALAEAVSDPSAITFHLHWLAPVFEGAQTSAEAEASAARLTGTLTALKARGVRLIWTVHNVTSHDMPWEAEERTLAGMISGLADAVHLHDANAYAELAAAFPLPPYKVRVAPHGNYDGFYPKPVPRVTARSILGLSQDDSVILFTGQLRAYKGLDTLIAAFGILTAERPDARLVLAGGVHPAFKTEIGIIEAAAAAAAPPGYIQIVPQFLEETELALWFGAADVAVYPYRRVLTSGSMLLALGQGVPVVVPPFAQAHAVIGPHPDAGVLWEPDTGPAGLALAIRRVLDTSRTARTAAARAAAAAQIWSDITPILAGGSEDELTEAA